jgi:hypothetical protein
VEKTSEINPSVASLCDFAVPRRRKIDANTGSGSGSLFHNASASFGGINIILCGDLHQFPPVAESRREYLYRPNVLATDPLDCQIGGAIYEEFDTIVILKQQMRVTDPIWHNLLTNLRNGEVQETDLHTLRELIIDHTQHDDFHIEPWSSASLVTPRHVVRSLWNEFAACKHCQATGELLFICTAEDTIGKTRTRASHLDGLDDGVVPVKPLSSRMDIDLSTLSTTKQRRTVLQRQFPISPAYAFTDYRSQGQTISHVIVDLASPPAGSLSLFNIYVALSQYRSCHNSIIARF